MKTTITAIVFAVATAGQAHADTPHEVVLTSSDRDNTLIESSTGALSQGQGDLYVGRTAQPSGSKRRGMIYFDVSGIPSNATITGATLSLFMCRANDGASSNRTTSVYAVLADWGEGSSFQDGGMGGASQTGDATWIHTFYPTTGTEWTTPGGDFVSTASGSGTSTQTSGDIDTFTGAGMAGDVQDWVGSAGDNFGWILIGDESVGQTARRYASREFQYDIDHSECSGTPVAPSLDITYTTP